MSRSPRSGKASTACSSAAALRFNPYTQFLEVAQARGFLGRGPAKRLHVGEGFAGRAVLERRTVTVVDLPAGSETLSARRLDAEGFRSHFCTPLVAKGLVKGVLELFHRQRLDPDPEWLEFFETLAGQTAIAIDSAEMFERLNRANAELLAAYDQTLEGWVRALDLRDRETEGHTERVTDMSVVMAQALDTTGEELLHVQRGARLHDFGKMAVPDGILLKPGQLTDDERQIMCRHPVYAKEMLSGIPFLRPALPQGLAAPAGPRLHPRPAGHIVRPHDGRSLPRRRPLPQRRRCDIVRRVGGHWAPRAAAGWPDRAAPYAPSRRRCASGPAGACPG